MSAARRVLISSSEARAWSREANRDAVLPSVEDVDSIPVARLPAFIAELAALQARASARLTAIALDSQGDDVRAYTVEEVAQKLRCSVDLVRERGEEWGIALVLTRDCNGRPTRVVYPHARLRRYLDGNPPTDGRSAA
jgi:hypothetical protein